MTIRSARPAALVVGHLLELPPAGAAYLLELVADHTCWLLGPAEGTWTIRVPPEPALRHATIQFWRLSAGGRLEAPEGGRERLLVLEGSLSSAAGLRCAEGGLLLSEPGGYRHALEAGAAGAVCLVVHEPAAVAPPELAVAGARR